MQVSSMSRASRRKGAIAPGLGWLDLILALATLTSFVAALYLAFVYAPTEAIQGDVQRIFYFHVPLAWLAYLAFFVVFCGSIMYLWKRSEAWDVAARCSAGSGRPTRARAFGSALPPPRGRADAAPRDTRSREE